MSFIVFGIIPLLFLSQLFFFRYNGIIRDNMTANYSAMTGYVAKNVSVVLKNVDEAMAELYEYEDANGDSLGDLLKNTDMNARVQEQAVMSALQNVMRKSDYISSVRMVDSNSRIYSVYDNPEKMLRSDLSPRYKTFAILKSEDPTALQLFGTFPEQEICVNSNDYVFSMSRNMMDISTVQTAHRIVLATVYADINISRIHDIMQKTSLTQGQFYIYNVAKGQYVYSENDEDYLNGANPLSFCENVLTGKSGFESVGNQWVFFNEIKDTDAYAVFVVDNTVIMGTFFQSRTFLLLILCFACAVMLILYIMFSIRMSAPTRTLKDAMEQVEQGNLDVRVNLDTHDEMEYVADGFNKMTERLSDYINQVYVAQICQKDAELNALKMQIQPHYLYNTLDVIRMTALDNEDKETARLLESLAHQLRYVIGEQSDRICLRDELDAIREYFVIMKARYEGRITLMIYVSDEDLNLLIPKLLLQPVVENSIRHGLREKEGNGAVAIRVTRKEEYLEIIVMDDGVGMGEEKVRRMQEILDSPEPGAAVDHDRVSVGMKNVYDRIKLNCGKEYGFTIESTLGVGTFVTYRLPIWEDSNDVENSNRG